MEIIESKDAEAILANYPILVQLYPVDKYPHMEFEEYKKLLPYLLKQGYRQIGAYEDGKCLGVAGFNPAVRLYLGRIIRVNDVIVDSEVRRSGVGKALVDWIEEEARRLGAVAMVLDSTIAKKDSHRFYEREGFNIHAHHFIKKL